MDILDSDLPLNWKPKESEYRPYAANEGSVVLPTLPVQLCRVASFEA